MVVLINAKRIMDVVLNSKGYSYDVHSLVKAFYPQEDVRIVEDNTELEINMREDVISVEVSSGDVNDGDIVSGFIKCSYKGVTEEKIYESVDRAAVKNTLKIALYELLSRINEKLLPWGTLTGIRPTKIPMKLLHENKSEEDIRRYLQEVYLCSDDKINLSMEIAQREDELLRDIDNKGYSLYVGIPFCPTTCLYCSFTSYPIVSWKKRVKDYLDALRRELLYVSENFRDKRLDSIYIGGGTPTTLDPEELTWLLDFIRSNFDLSYVREITVEAGRPDSITEDKLAALKKCGVSRISINPQTMNDKTLKLIGRRHNVEEVVKAFKLAREYDFDNINMDIILGLPGEDISDVRQTLERIKELGPDSLTVHSMAIKRAAGMQKYLEEHDEIKTINTPEMMEEAISFARSMGLDPYYLYRQKNMTGNLENIGFAREGKYGVYNILIMEEVQTIVACGAGTVTKRVYAGDGPFGSTRIERCDNVKDVALYTSKIEEMIDRKRELFKD